MLAASFHRCTSQSLTGSTSDGTHKGCNGKAPSANSSTFRTLNGLQNAHHIPLVSATKVKCMDAETNFTPNALHLGNSKALSLSGIQTVGISSSAVIVTDKKIAPENLQAQSAQMVTVSQQKETANTLDTPRALTPLHEMTNFVANDSLQSVMKSKRLFQSSSKGRGPGPGPRIVDKFSTSTLGQFAAKHCAEKGSSWEECVEHGVKDVTMRVTSVNATKLRFCQEDGSPLFFLGQRDAPRCSHVGKSSDIREWLCRQGCDKSLIPEKWVQNHFRWVVWKLAAMERRFPEQLAGHYLTYSHVLSQIKGRYEKELRGARRPAVRKVLNKDVTASSPMILCVSQILRFKSKAPRKEDDRSATTTMEEVRLELTDGWYAVSTIVDSALTALVGRGKIQLGSKLMICNAQLVGSDEGVDPLDEDYCSDRRNCPLFLKISANCSRLAKWDAKLGFVHPKHTASQGGSFLVKSLSDVFPEGGLIPAIDLIICKRYPRMFLEQLKDSRNQNTVSNHLTEAEEAARQNEHDLKQQRASEMYADAARKECSEVSL